MPTSCQKELFNKLGLFLAASANDSWLMVISGYAGTGKTTAIGALISVLKEYDYKYILIAPTGRSAKVLANYTGVGAKTIHKQIYRQKTMNDGYGLFSLDLNKNRNTLFIVDEASLLSNGMGMGHGSIFGSGDVLDDLITYIRSNEGNRLILMGDTAQLPPIGLEQSPALDTYYLERYTKAIIANLSTVVRQEKESGILHNATRLRKEIEMEELCNPKFNVKDFDDIKRITGGELIEEISNAIDKYGLSDIVVLCRSNNRANKYNLGIRQSILFREEQLTKGDKLMIVKNCYQFLEKVPELDFIAN
ncbi:MAG: AAA family ATPase, partial [Bacteroidales bacterium]